MNDVSQQEAEHASRSHTRRIAPVIAGLLTVVALGAVSLPAAAAQFVVNTTADSVDADPGDGVCGDAQNRCSLRAAVMQANADAGADTINVLPGTYTLSLTGRGENAAHTGDLDITDDLTITGSGGDRDGDPAATIIQAGPSTAAGIDRVVSINPTLDTPMDVALEALMIRHGKVTGYGGGIEWDGGGTDAPGSLTIYNCIVSDNEATDGDGGGILLTNNLGDVSAPAFVTIDKSVIRNNSVTNGGGGGIAIGFLVGLVLTNSTVADNTSTFTGGFVSDGGGISAIGAGGYTRTYVMEIRNSTISGNVAEGGRGGGLYSGQPTSIENTTISGNRSTGRGGGVWAHVNTGQISTFINVTIADNQADSDTGGLYYTEDGTLTLHNTIVVGNVGGAGGGPSDVRGGLDGASSHNLVGSCISCGLTDGNNGNQVGVSDPRLGPLADNGGRVWTHPLLSGSPALDAGDNAQANGAGLTTDSRGPGFARLRDAGDLDTVEQVDIGAFEAHPVVEDISEVTISEDGSGSVTYNVGDHDADTGDGNPGFESVFVTSNDQNLLPDGNITRTDNGSTHDLDFQPAANRFGSAKVTVEVHDTVAGTDQVGSGTFTVRVDPVADPPDVSQADGTSIPEGTMSPALVIDRNAVDGDEVTHFKITDITNGTLYKSDGTTQITNGAFVTVSEGQAGLKFRPDDGKHSDDGSTFKFTVQGATDGSGSGLGDGSDVVLTVRPPNDPPAGTDDAYTVNEDETLTVDAAEGVLENDSDPDGDALTAELVSGPSQGTLTLNSDGSFTYEPSADFSGDDTFTYRASDGALESSEATVTITVEAVNDPPTGTDDAYTVNEDETLTVDAAEGVLENDSDPDGDALTAELVSGPSQGTLTLNEDGSFTYEPSADFFGDDTFTYRTSDGTLESNEATVTITVEAVNDPPAGTDDTYTVNEDETLTVDAAEGVLENDSDPDGDALTAELVSGPSQGTLTLNPDGSFTYEPSADFSGDDTFTYRASDGTLESSEATVTIEVNVPPTLSILAPTKGSVWTGRHVIEWTANDPDGDDASLEIDLYYARLGPNDSPQGPWRTIALNQENDGEFEWNAASVTSGRGRYRIRAVATDEVGEKGEAESDPFLVSAVTDLVTHGPNPASTEITFYFGEGASGTLYVYGAAGELVWSVEVQPGTISHRWNLVNRDGQALANGLYLYTLVNPEGVGSSVRRLIIIR